MRIRSKALSLIWKFAIVLCAFVGIGLQIGIFSGELRLSSFRYFTNLSNLLCMLYFLADTVYILSDRLNDGSKSWCLPLKGITMMGITVTWLVSFFLLGNFTMGASMRVSILLVHTIVPILTILDWLLFGEKGRFNRTSPLLWTIFPLMYFLIVMLLALVSRGDPFYPYPFMNVAAQGLVRVLVTVAVITVFFIALGYLFVLADRLLAKAGKRFQQSFPSA